MAKHAICIMGFGSPNIARKIIEILDDKDIDFFIHWDKKSDLPDFKAKFSNISRLPKRRRARSACRKSTII